MADINTQMTQRNATNTAWDNLHPYTKAANVKTNSGSDVETDLAQKASQTSVDNILKDYVRSPAYGKTAGTATAYTLILNPAPTTYVDGMSITIVPHIDCGDNPTLKVNSLTALPILKQDGSALVAGDIKIDKPYSLVRVGNNFFIRSSGGYNKGSYIPVSSLKFNSETLLSFEYGAGNIKGIVLDKDKNMYICTSDPLVAKLSPTGQEIWRYTGFSLATFCIDIDSDGNSYVGGTDYINGNAVYTVRKISPSGQEVWKYTGHTGKINSVKVGNDGNVYSGSTDYTVRKISPSGQEVWKTSIGRTVLDLEIYNNEYIYVGSDETAIYKLTTLGVSTFFAHNKGNITGIGLDKFGNVYSGGSGMTIKKFSGGGSLIWESKPFNQLLSSLYVDCDGIAYGSEYSTRVVKILFQDGTEAYTIYPPLIGANHIITDDKKNIYIVNGRTVTEMSAYYNVLI